VAFDAGTRIPPGPRRLSAEWLRRLRREVLLPRLFGAIWFVVGAAMLVVFFVVGSPVTDFRLQRNHETAIGTVTGITRRGSRNPYRIAYTFMVEGAAYKGRSFSSRLRGHSRGTEVAIEYLPDDPMISRIEGLRYSAIPLTMYLLPGFFVVAGGMIWGFGMVKFIRLRRLCEHGWPAAGTVVSARWNKLMSMKTSLRAPRRFLYELRYRFTDDRGRERDSTQRTYAPADSFAFKEGDAVTVLFDRTNPARSLVADVLDVEFADAARPSR